jgi:two-component system OmpR family sensor kinase
MFSAIRARIRRSVPARLTFWYLLTLGGALFVFAVFACVVRARALYGELDADLEVRGHQLVDDLRPALLGLDVAGDLAANRRIASVPMVVREVPGAPLYRSPALPALDWTSERQLAEAARSATAIVAARARDGQALHVLTLIVNRPGTESLSVQLAAPTAPVFARLRDTFLFIAAAIAFVLAVAGYGSMSTSRRALRPVHEIVARARHIQAHRLNERLDVKAESEELARLVTTLNEMLDRIGDSVQAARRFAADASHELQTPLAAMRTAVELALAGDRRDDYRGMAADLLVEITRVSTLVRDLRLLALAEAGQVVTASEHVKVAVLANECCEVARAIAEEKRIRLDLRIDAQPIVDGSSLHLRRIVLNLAENAIRYSPEDSTVDIGVGLVDSQASVTVRDRGCGIGAADLPHIFEPFYRADPARARDTGGSGLGLAIADQVARAHGGRLEVQSELGRGSVFTLWLPLSQVRLEADPTDPLAKSA